MYDEGLAQRIRELLIDELGITEKKMFGGLCYLKNGNMICGVVDDKLMARVPKEMYEGYLSHEYVTKMDFTGRPMRGMIYVSVDGVNQDEILEKWVGISNKYASSLPPK